jgi:histidinol phosphatase-like PHP family hydrolase
MIQNGSTNGPAMDVNLALAGLLYDLAHLAGKTPRAFGYTRAAKAVLGLDRQITPLVHANTFKAIPGIGPTTDRIARELIHEGGSPFVERAIDAAGQEEAVARLRALRQHFLSRAAVREIVSRPGSPSRSTYRGDFQMHSVWSDGAEPLASIVEACLARRRSCAGITDHSYGLAVARGMTMEAVGRQHEEVDALNAKYGRRFRVFKGIEANIRSDGTVDMTADELRRFEFVVASPHALLRKSDDQTARMVCAVSQPGVCVLGHPQGRKYNVRRGVRAKWDLVFQAAARRQVAIEIDGFWDRQDVHYELAARALAHGCIFALDSDAHSNPELDFADVAIAHAKLAGIPQERIINYWSNKRILDWAQGAWER